MIIMMSNKVFISVNVKMHRTGSFTISHNPASPKCII